MILNGLTITIIGMAIVFAFLVILVLAMNLLFITLKKFFPKALSERPESKAIREREAASSPAGDENGPLPEIAAAIAAATAYSISRG